MQNPTTPPSKPSTPTGPFLTAKELSARWKLSLRNVRRKISRGDIPVHRMGYSVRISIKDIAIYEAKSAVAL